MKISKHHCQLVQKWSGGCVGGGGGISAFQVINNRAQYVRIYIQKRAADLVERHFTVNSAACHLTGICLEREDYSDPQGEGCVQSSSCNCLSARWFDMVWNLRRCLLLRIFELFIEEPV